MDLKPETKNKIYVEIDIITNEELSDFCALKSVLTQGFSGDYTVFDNFSNPTMEGVVNDCP